MTERIHQLSRLINKNLPESTESISDPGTEQELFDALRARVRYLLNHDMERLLHTLYRVDVAEDLVKKTLAESDPEMIDHDLSVLILNRIQQKLETRRKYAQS